MVYAGSANINERSLAGTRDTEIAAVIWQPSHMSGPSVSGQAPVLARGQVHSFRMSVWREHLANGGTNQDVATLMDPWSLHCVQRVQQLTEVRPWAVETGCITSFDINSSIFQGCVRGR